MNLTLHCIHFNSSSYLFTDPCHYGWCSEDLPELPHAIHTTWRHQRGGSVCISSLTILSS